MECAIPELPEVETIRRQLSPWLTGRTIVSANRADAPPGPKYAHLEQAAGGKILAVNRRGKFLILPLDIGHELIIHLGMTGVLTPVRPAGHLRVVIELNPGPDASLYFQDIRRFGRFFTALRGDRSGCPSLLGMGPEPLSDAFTLDGFVQALRSLAAIKTRLLSQRAVAGLGNIYVDEALWQIGVHPERRAEGLEREDVAALRSSIIALLRDAVEQGGTTLNNYRNVRGEAGAFKSQLQVYGRTNEPCMRCGTAIRRSVVGQRGTHWCPRCQAP